MITVLGAISDNGIVGVENRIPWTKEELPKDLPHFFRQTVYGTMIMGRNTFESMGILKNRSYIVVSNTLPPDGKTKLVVPDFTTALQQAIKDHMDEFQEDYPISIIGGYRIWQEALQSEFVTRALITRVHKNFEGDTVFPEKELRENFTIFYKDEWKEKEEGKISSTLQVWRRKK